MGNFVFARWEAAADWLTPGLLPRLRRGAGFLEKCCGRMAQLQSGPQMRARTALESGVSASLPPPRTARLCRTLDGPPDGQPEGISPSGRFAMQRFGTLIAW